MAVQAQYPSNAFRLRNNGLEEFQHRENNNISGNLFGGYNNNNNYVGQNILNGTVFSDLESELTCNVSGSRKRSRDDQMVLTQQHQQQMLHQPHHHHHQQILQQQQQQQVLSQFRFTNFPKGQVFDTTATATATATAISTALQLSYEENRLHGSEGTSTSGRPSAVSPSLPSPPLAQDLNSYLLHQNLEIDTLILLHNEKLRLLLEETRKRHCRSLVSVLEQKILNRLEEKETELENASRRNAELEEKIKQMSAENQIWFNVAKNNEALVSNLRSSLEEILLQNKGQTREGFGDSDGVTILADDAQSCCYEGAVEEDKTVIENRDLKNRKSCKVCRENEVSVLLLPCRHLCLCKNCESKIVSCPICKSTKNASLQIFVS